MVRVRGSLRAIDFGHVEGVRRLAEKAGSGRLRLPGLEVCRSFDWVRFARPEVGRHAGAGYVVRATVPGILPIPSAESRISLELIEKKETSQQTDCVYNGELGCIDWGRLSNSLELRNWRPGDRYQPVGRTGAEKIRTLFQEARIPLWERRGWPVLTDGVSIVWTRKFGAAAGLAAADSTRVILRVRETGPPD